MIVVVAGGEITHFKYEVILGLRSYFDTVLLLWRFQDSQNNPWVMSETASAACRVEAIQGVQS